MKLKTTILIALSFCTIISSCLKQKAACTGNCYPITIKGTVIDKSSASGISYIPITAEWIQGGSCIGCTVYTIGETKTLANGSFSIAANIDTSKFSSWYLSVKMPADSSYFITPAENEVHYFNKRFYTLDVAALQQSNFNLYEKVLFTIRLHRTQADPFNAYFIGHGFRDNPAVSGFTFYNPAAAPDTILQLKTAPGIFTIVYSRKNFAGNSFVETTDSLICTAGGSNTIDVNY